MYYLFTHQFLNRIIRFDSKNQIREQFVEKIQPKTGHRRLPPLSSLSDKKYILYCQSIKTTQKWFRTSELL